jgi:hypothetical protein
MQAKVIFVDIDDTLVRSVGTKRIPMPAEIANVRRLHTDGATLYLWSSGLTQRNPGSISADSGAGLPAASARMKAMSALLRESHWLTAIAPNETNKL